MESIVLPYTYIGIHLKLVEFLSSKPIKHTDNERAVESNNNHDSR